MIAFLLTVLIVMLVVGLLCWVINLLPIPQPWNRIVQAILALIGLLYLLQSYLPPHRF